VAILERNGFVEIRQRGSHRQFRADIGGEIRIVTVAYHAIGDEILQGTLASMIRQSRLPKSTFRK
jgi:predicted RNA binding protein YcfA (HicA-like mRNA interferase family)